MTAVRVKYMVEKVGLAQVSCGVIRFSLPAPFHESSVPIPLSCDRWTIAHLNAAVRFYSSKNTPPLSITIQVAGTCESGNEISGSTKCGEFLD